MTTIIRVKRPRTSAPLESMRLETHTSKRSRVNRENEEVELLGELMHASTYISQKQEQHRNVLSSTPQCSANKNARKSVVFKRFLEDDCDTTEESFLALSSGDVDVLPERLRGLVSNGSHHPSNQHVKIVDCAAVEDHDTISIIDNRHRPRKRAKIRMVRSREVSISATATFSNGTTSTSASKQQISKQKKKSPTKRKGIILDPITRMVDECLIKCHDEYSVQPFIDLMDSNSNSSVLATAAPGSDMYMQLLNRQCSNGRGTALHIAAMVNDMGSTMTLLRLGIDSTLEDCDGMTSAKVATLVGNDAIAQALHEAGGEDNDAAFVYDYYVVEEESSSSSTTDAAINGDHGPPGKKDHVAATNGDGMATNSSTNAGHQRATSSSSMEKDDDNIPTVDFEGGFGYWDDNGVLVLEKGDTDDAGANDQQGELDYDSNEEGFEVRIAIASHNVWVLLKNRMCCIAMVFILIYKALIIGCTFDATFYEKGNDYPEDEDYYTDDDSDDDDNCYLNRMPATHVQSKFISNGGLDPDDYNDGEYDDEYRGTFGGPAQDNDPSMHANCVGRYAYDDELDGGSVSGEEENYNDKEWVNGHFR